jgi:hypothetical protein
MGEFERGLSAMHAVFSSRSIGMFAFVLLLPGLASAPSAHAQAAQPAAPAPAASTSTSAAAHKVLEAGLKANALGGDSLTPWHLKLDFQVLEPGATKPTAGTFEQWSTGRYQWRRTYSSSVPAYNGTEWSVSHIERYQTKAGKDGFDHVKLNQRIARPVVDPMYQAANIKPDYEMELKRFNAGGTVLNCVMVVNPAQYTPPDTNPDWLFPTLCFDSDSHLRVASTAGTVEQFSDFQIFQGRAVAKDVKVLLKGDLIAEMKVTVLEPLSDPSAVAVKPGKNIIPQAFSPEPGDPKLETVYEEGASIPLSTQHKLFIGTIEIPAIIQKDGSVKVIPHEAWNQAQVDAVQDAVRKWKYKPYVVDGQPVEVETIISYETDGKPYVPSYARPKAAPVATRPDDFSSAYDPKRDPDKDLAMAKAQAKQAHKRILIVVGGDWCVWCKYLDKFYEDHADVKELRDANYVLMKVNMSSLNENTAFLAQFPKIPAYPYFFVLDADGKVLTSQRSHDLENGADSYDVKAFKEFLTAWKPL